MQAITVIKSKIAGKYDLQEWQVGLLEYLMLPKALRPHRSFLMAKFNIAESTYYYCLRSPKFNNARRDFTKQFYKDDIPDILMAMKDEAISGNERAARLFLEYIDDWNKDPRSIDPAAPQVVNIAEAKQTIINLTQKFYGTPEPPKVIEAAE
jgi:hypothetical protein